MSNSCYHHLLVSSNVCQVKYCADCDNVHLALGAMTLHLTGDQFEQLAQNLRKAAVRKRDIDQPLSASADTSSACVVSFPGPPATK